MNAHDMSSRRATGAGHEDAVAPDFIEPVIGWRLWLVVSDGGYLWLESVLHVCRWSPRRALQARCVQHRRCYFCNQDEVEDFPAHAAPDPDCDCGIYAARSPEALVPYLESAYPGRPSLGPVVGRVRLWGRVVSAERGWRGEYAYPDALYAPPQLMPAQQPESPCTAGLADYAVPVLPLVGATTPEVVESLRAA